MRSPKACISCIRRFIAMYTLLKCKVYLFWTRGCIHVTRASVCTMYTCFRKWRRLRIRNFTARIRGMPTNGATCIRAKRRARRFFMYTHAEKKHCQCILIFKRSMLLARASVYTNSSSARRMYTQKRGHGDFPCIRTLRKNIFMYTFFQEKYAACPRQCIHEFVVWPPHVYAEASQMANYMYTFLHVKHAAWPRQCIHEFVVALPRVYM